MALQPLVCTVRIIGVQTDSNQAPPEYTSKVLASMPSSPLITAFIKRWPPTRQGIQVFGNKRLATVSLCNGGQMSSATLIGNYMPEGNQKPETATRPKARLDNLKLLRILEHSSHSHCSLSGSLACGRPSSGALEHLNSFPS
jgi:hypothetical protein